MFYKKKKNLETTLIKNVSGYQITINLLTLLKRPRNSYNTLRKEVRTKRWELLLST